MKLKKISLKVHKQVFYLSLALIMGFVLYGTLRTTEAERTFTNLQNWTIDKFNWIYVLSVALILIFCIYLMFSRFGDIKLGPDHSEPAYSNASWFSLLFAAGMGGGLLFFGVVEPVMHYLNPPVGKGETLESAKEALNITFFHWGLHAWGIYALLGLALAYFAYRHKLPLKPRSALYPIIGDRIYGPIGNAVDIVSIVGTVFGVATSLGYGVTQINTGLNYLYNIPINTFIQLILMSMIIVLATISVIAGMDKGVKRLSEINLIMTVALLIFVLVMGPTETLFRLFVQNTGAYLSDLVNKTFNLYAYEPKADWIGGWTILYWAWWISWSPFVGTFIASVSKGRTIRQFIIGVLLVPSGFTFIWMTVFGNSAINTIMNKGVQSLADSIKESAPLGIFKFLETLPMTGIVSLYSILLITLFFVTSLDSGALVISNLAAKGHEATKSHRVFWSFSQGIIAAVLLVAGGLTALQTATMISAVPMILVLMLIAIGLLKALKDDNMKGHSITHHTTTLNYGKSNISWQKRLNTLFDYPTYKFAQEFLKEKMKPAMSQFIKEIEEYGIQAKLEEQEESIWINVTKEGTEDFIYGVYLKSTSIPVYTPQNEVDNQEHYYRAEVFLKSGGQNYDVLGYSQEQLINDALSQYEKHLHFVHLSTSEEPGSKDDH